MIGPRAQIPDRRWREKLSPPRPLQAIDGALYGPPARPGAPAYLAWIYGDDPDRALEAAVSRARDDRATSLVGGGPPGNYLVSGPDTDQEPWFLARGFTLGPRTVDLHLDPRGAEADERVVLAARPEETLRWIADRFSAPWRDEATRAHLNGGLFCCVVDQRLAGFVAIHGNNADAGTFGPVGVDPSFRGRGLGEALTRTALHALAGQGFDEVVVPWVAPETSRFYRSIARVVREASRVSVKLALNTGSA